MKKFWILVVMMLSVAVAYSEVTYYGNLTNTTGLVQSNSYSLDMLNSNGQTDRVSMQAVYSTDKYYQVIISTPNVNLTTSVITSTQSYVTGYSVLFTSTAFTFTGLKNNTTYYIIPLTSTLIQLATTQAMAFTGSYIQINQGALAPGGKIYLTPIDVQSTSPFGLIWQASNDNSNWYSVGVTTVSILGATTTTNYLWDFGSVNYQYLRANVIGGNFGSIDLKIEGIGKHN